MSLEERLFKSFDDQQKVEHEAREIETLIKSFEGASGLLPDRAYGTSVDPSKFGLTLKSIIESENPRLAAYLNISTGYHKRMEEETRRRQEYIDNFKAKTEELQLKNAEQRQIREQRLMRGLDPVTGQPLI